MRANRRSQDWVHLSAYLDGEMTAREKQNFEQRLRASKELQAQLAELRSTRAMIRSLPRKKAPRSFALSPEMVRRKKTTGWLPLMGLTSAASAILAFVLLFFQFAPGMFFASQPMLRDAGEEVAMFAEEAQMEAQDEEGDPDIIYWGGPPTPNMVEGMGGGDGIDLAPQGKIYPEEAEAAPMLESPAEAEAEPAEEQPAEAMPAPEMEAPQEESLAEPAPTVDETLDDAAEGEAQDLILGIQPTEERPQLPTHSSIPERKPVSPQVITLAVAVFLGMISLGTGIFAFILWRRTR